MYHEQDPLLPKDHPAPEIHGSRAQSINDVQGSDESCGGVTSDFVDKPPKGLGDIVALFTGLVTLVLVALMFAPDGFGEIGGKDPTSRTIDERVASILTDTPLIGSSSSFQLIRADNPHDGHDDLAILIRYLYNSHIYNESFRNAFENGGMRGHVDLPRLKKGKMGGAFWAAFVPCPENGMDFSDENYASSVAFTYSQIDLLSRLQAQYPTQFSPPPNSSTALSVFRSGQIISPLAIEGLHQIGNSMSNLRNYYDLGVRYATLTHNCHNRYADAALLEVPGGGIVKAKPYWGGVSPAGRELIHEMNRLGMIVDISHVSYDTMLDVLGGGNNSWRGSIAPPIFSHSSAYSLCPHPRNVPDDVLQLVKKRESIVMVNFSPDFVSCVASHRPGGVPDFYPKNSTLTHVVEHIMHIGELIGYDHVGLGSDFDGIAEVPKGLDDVSKFPELVAEMLKMGVSDENASKVVGGNLLRVWADVDAVARNMQAAGEIPLEDDLSNLWDEVPGRYLMKSNVM